MVKLIAALAASISSVGTVFGFIVLSLPFIRPVQFEEGLENPAFIYRWVILAGVSIVGGIVGTIANVRWHISED